MKKKTLDNVGEGCQIESQGSHDKGQHDERIGQNLCL